MILRAFDIKYMPRTLVKGQVLADLVAEFAKTSYKSEIQAHHMDDKSVGSIASQELSHWRVYIGAANQRGSGVGLVLISSEKLTIEKSLRLGFSAINNEVEYETLLEGMSMVQSVGGKAIKFFHTQDWSLAK